MRPGDVVIVDFVGATGVKRRPAVVISSDAYHRQRPDVILGVITSNTSSATTEFDYVLGDWRAAGLHSPSAFRAYFSMSTSKAVKVVGKLSVRDWEKVQERIKKAIV